MQRKLGLSNGWIKADEYSKISSLTKMVSKKTNIFVFDPIRKCPELEIRNFLGHFEVRRKGLICQLKKHVSDIS